MELIHGKQTLHIDAATLAVQLRGYQNILIDLGTGDGRYVHAIAAARPGWFVIGVDACRENLRQVSRRTLRNVLFAIANARALPPELDGVATEITINFPWGSLLTGLLQREPVLLAGLRTLARPGAVLHVRLNSEAVARTGWDLMAGAEVVRRGLRNSGWKVARPSLLDGTALRWLPSTWAKRLAYGRDPRALYLHATYAASPTEWRGSGIHPVNGNAPGAARRGG
jgi:16S rRNA (adenine(1408)-N(1))-methyltransferase